MNSRGEPAGHPAAKGFSRDSQRLRFIHIKAAKVGLELEYASAVKDKLTRRGYQVVGGNAESFKDPHAIVIHGACQ